MKKYSNYIYVLILIFSLLFYLLLMGASGHGFHFSSTDKIAFIFAIFGILIVPNYKSQLIKNKQIKLFISIFSLIASIGTLTIGILVLKNSLEFKYGKDVSSITIGLFYLIPFIFILINGIIINEIVKELRK